MANKVLLKKSSTAAKVPTTSDLDYGELALNYADGKLYYKNSSNVVQSFGSTSYTKVTSNTTAVAGKKYICDTTAAAFTLTLPASPVSGDTVVIGDGGSFYTNNLTVGRNSSTIDGITDDLALNITGIEVTLVYDGTTWQVYTQIGANGGSEVTLAGTQTLTNKTLDAPTITGGASITYTPATATGYALTTTGKDTIGGTGYFDFFKATNTTSGVSNGSKSFRLNNVGTLEVLNSAYSAAIASLDNSGNLITTGSVRPQQWDAGQVIKDTMLDNSQFTVNATTVATGNTDTDFITYSYTPVSSSSYLIIHVHVASYDALTGSGGGSDSYFSRIKVGGAEITYGRQATVTSNSSRTGSLFPLIGRYTNSSTSAKTITVGVRRDSADDNITIVNSGTALWMRITEVAR